MKPFRGILGRLIGDKLPLRIKRLIFISSVFGNTAKRGIDHETLKRLNLVMQLASSEDALGFPVLLSHVIWRGKETIYVNTSDILVKQSSTDISTDLKAIVQSAPSWLRYADSVGMERDLQQLFLNINAVSH